MSMDLPIEYTISMKCRKCSQVMVTKVLIDDLELVNTFEREMGTEGQYDFTVEVTCVHCGSSSNINGEVWEYPEGSINDISLNLDIDERIKI